MGQWRCWRVSPQRFLAETLSIALTLERNLVLSLLCLLCGVFCSVITLYMYTRSPPSLPPTHSQSPGPGPLAPGREAGPSQSLSSDVTALVLSTWVLRVPEKPQHWSSLGCLYLCFDHVLCLLKGLALDVVQRELEAAGCSRS